MSENVVVVSPAVETSPCGFAENNPDTMQTHPVNTLVPVDHFTFMWRLSWGILISSFYAAYRGYYDCAALTFCVFVTSINYWRNPVYGLRRNIDITAAVLTCGYQTYKSFSIESGMYYRIGLSIALMMYPISWMVYKNNLWLSTILHGCLHIIGNISNCILYVGESRFPLRPPPFSRASPLADPSQFARLYV